MTAREMFSKLGFECVERETFIRYRKTTFDEKQVIYFVRYSEQVEMDCVDSEDDSIPFLATSELFAAINQQLKELGWLE